MVKRAIVPKLDVLASFDYDSIEMRLLAYFMAVSPSVRDRSLVDEFIGGLDPHAETTKKVLGLDREPSKTERQVGKRLNFSVIYGGGRPTIMRQLELDWQGAGRLLRRFHAERPGIQHLQAAMAGTLERRGYVKTLWGRHLHVLEEHKLLNAVIQGSAADLKKAAMIKVDRWQRQRGLRSHMVMEVHDDILMDCALEELPLVADSMQSLMTDARLEGVLPIPVGREIGRSWAEKTPYEEWEPIGSAP